jgi:hypothetical protein
LIVVWSPTLQISDSAGMTLSLNNLPNDPEKLKAMVLAISAETEAAQVEIKVARDQIEAAQARTEAALAEKAKLAAEHARLDHEHTVLSAEVERTRQQNERLEHIINVLRRARFGRKSERINVEQMALALEDVETSFTAEDAIAEKKNKIVRGEGKRIRRANRGHLPANLPREEVVIEPEAKACPCCGGALHVIGEDTSERLDKIPSRLRVIVKGWSTMIKAGDTCSSACAIAWLGGATRYVWQNSKVGFHAAHNTLEDGSNYKVVSAIGNALIGAYVNELGLGAAAVEYVVSPEDPKSMKWAKALEASKVGIHVQILADDVTMPTLAPPKAPAAVEAKQKAPFSEVAPPPDFVPQRTRVVPKRDGR